MSLAGWYVKLHYSRISCDSAGDCTASITDPCQGLSCHCTNWHSTGFRKGQPCVPWCTIYGFLVTSTTIIQSCNYPSGVPWQFTCFPKKCSTFSLTGNPFSKLYFLFITFLCLFSCKSSLYITCFQNSFQTALRPQEKFIMHHHMFLALNRKSCAHKQYFQTEDCCLLLGTADGTSFLISSQSSLVCYLMHWSIQ
jgi:hypothetical protein